MGKLLDVIKFILRGSTMETITFDLQGAKNIATFLGLPGRRQVYKLLEHKRLGKTNIPIWTEPGIGVVSSRTLLQNHILQRAGTSGQKTDA